VALEPDEALRVEHKVHHRHDLRQFELTNTAYFANYYQYKKYRRLKSEIGYRHICGVGS